MSSIVRIMFPSVSEQMPFTLKVMFVLGAAVAWGVLNENMTAVESVMSRMAVSLVLFSIYTSILYSIATSDSCRDKRQVSVELLFLNLIYA
jgi:hypothetical protein